MKLAKFLSLSVLAFFFLSCGGSHLNPDWEARVGPQKFYAEAYVERSTAPMSVIPSNTPNSPPKAIMYSFDMDQDIDYRQKIGRELGEIFYKNWVGKGVFPQLVYESERSFPGKKQALDYARQKGFDLVIMGEINNYLFGGSQGSTHLNIQVDIFQVSNNMLIWSMDHSGRIENQPKQDYILWKTEVRMPESPAYVIMSALAKDLARPVKEWSYGKDWREVTENY